MTLTHSQKLDRMIQYGIINTPENVYTAHVLLNHISPDTMLQEDVARRWPRIVAALICESLGYFTPRSAANAVLAFRLGRAFGCEYYCFSAGFERDGWPPDYAVYDAKLKEVGRRKIQSAFRQRHSPNGYMRDFPYALKLVREMAGGAANPPSLLASWF